MNILLINPPNCGRSIPEERYGITSLKQIFRGEPLALEELAGNLRKHCVRILDLKVDPERLAASISDFCPDLVGITGVTCEANTILSIACQVKEICGARIVVGGVHASNDPVFFNHPSVDFIVLGLGKRIFAELLDLLEAEDRLQTLPPGVLKTQPEKQFTYQLPSNQDCDMVYDEAPAYELVDHYRSHYILEKLEINMGFVATAYGCPYDCSFCCIKGQTGGRYLAKPIDTVLRDIRLLRDIPVIRLVDANTFGDIGRAQALGLALKQADLGKQFLADIRSDTVVQHPKLIQEWKDAGLRAVIIGFEEVQDNKLMAMNKANRVAVNTEAISILKEIGITIVGDFIISPQYVEEDFERLATYLKNTPIDLPMITVMTPLPGTRLFAEQKHQIINHDLDYYTLTNAVTKTTLDEKRFYTLYAELLASSHETARL